MNSLFIVSTIRQMYKSETKHISVHCSVNHHSLANQSHTSFNITVNKAIHLLAYCRASKTS